MKRRELVKTIIREYIKDRKVLVNLACHGEMYCFQGYLKQQRARYEAMPLEVLERIVRTIELGQFRIRL